MGTFRAAPTIECPSSLPSAYYLLSYIPCAKNWASWDAALFLRLEDEEKRIIFLQITIQPDHKIYTKGPDLIKSDIIPDNRELGSDPYIVPINDFPFLCLLIDLRAPNTEVEVYHAISGPRDDVYVIHSRGHDSSIFPCIGNLKCNSGMEDLLSTTLTAPISRVCQLYFCNVW